MKLKSILVVLVFGQILSTFNVNAASSNRFQVCVKGDPTIGETLFRYLINNVFEEIIVPPKQYNEETCGKTFSLSFNSSPEYITAKFALWSPSDASWIAEDEDIKYTIDTSKSYHSIWKTSPEGCNDKYQVFPENNGETFGSCIKMDDMSKFGFNNDSLVKLYYNPKKNTSLNKVIEVCSSSDNGSCIPFGVANSALFKITDYYPSSTYEDKFITVENSQSLEFSIGGEVGGAFDPSGSSLTAGLNVGFTNSAGTAVSEDLQTFYVVNTGLRNDIGTNTEYRMSKNAVVYALDNANVDKDGFILNGDEVLGSKLWRALDISSTTSWEDNVRSSNCYSKTLTFINQVELSRKESMLLFNEDVYQRNYLLPVSVDIDTQCLTDSVTGKRYRVLNKGML
ncbi:hypothetical protein ACX06_11820 (plasmid) [Vibrio parahaemolyticus]|uniref:hypothetical protein n=1 Tax=Vibrio parahaemolyticus TaxID=670 RepID=UPI0006B274A1|nr:hypothetical protein [Vibrio parahaemolyticus]KOY23776.1 hypothetical protein ACX06_11820 [Vibrio parahaemolyticus]